MLLSRFRLALHSRAARLLAALSGERPPIDRRRFTLPDFEAEAERVASHFGYAVGSEMRDEFVAGYVAGLGFVTSDPSAQAVRWTYEFTIGQLRTEWSARELGWALAVQPVYEKHKDNAPAPFLVLVPPTERTP